MIISFLFPTIVKWKQSCLESKRLRNCQRHDSILKQASMFPWGKHNIYFATHTICVTIPKNGL